MADKKTKDIKYFELGKIIFIFMNDLPNEYFRTFKVLPIISIQIENMFEGKWNFELILSWMWFTFNISYASKKLRKDKK